MRLKWITDHRVVSWPLLTWAFALLQLVTSSDLFELRLLHMNDLHSRFQQVTRTGSKCTQKALRADQCVGGVARIKYKVDQIKNSSSDDNVLFLMAGDLFQVSINQHTLF